MAQHRFARAWPLRIHRQRTHRRPESFRPQNNNGVILCTSGERSLKAITISDEWKPLHYEFDVYGIEDVELVCLFRGRGAGLFDASSLRLTRKTGL